MRKSVIAIVTGVLLLGACTSGNKWKVEGSADASQSGSTIYLAELKKSGWVTVDSASVSPDGSFSFSGLRYEAPQILKLSLNGSDLFIPVDSTEIITIDATGNSFANDSRISGSLSADMMQQINDIVYRALTTDPASLQSEAVKREISTIMSQNLGGIASYYAVNKTVGDKPLFDAANSFDKRIIGGVATQFATKYPDDPRAAQLQQLFLSNRRLFNSTPTVLQAEEIPFVDIKLTDTKGIERSLSEVWGSGKTVILNFTSLTAPESPAINVALNEVYENFSGRGVEIYQIGVDNDEFLWSSAAKALPWISVYCNPNTDASALIQYNVAAFPTTFVISRDGNRMERVTDLTKLSSTVSSML